MTVTTLRLLQLCADHGAHTIERILIGVLILNAIILALPRFAWPRAPSRPEYLQPEITMPPEKPMLLQNTPPITWRNLIITFLPILLPPLIDWIMKKLREEEEQEGTKQ